jgi:hypothetical protein
MHKSSDSLRDEESEDAARAQESRNDIGSGRAQSDPGRATRPRGIRVSYPRRRASGLVTVRVRPYLPTELAKSLVQRCVADRITLSAAVTAAVEQWVDGTSDRTLIMKRLDRLGRAIERSHRDAEFHSKAFSVFMHTWLVHTRSVAPQDRAAALESAKKRFGEMVTQVVKEFSDGRRFIDDLPQEPVAHDAELDAILAKAEAGKKRERP